MYNQFYKFLDAFKQFNPALVEAIGTGFGAIYEVFDKGGDLKYMGDGVVDVTLSDGTNFNVNTKRSSNYIKYTTAQDNHIEVSITRNDGFVNVNFKRLDNGHYGYNSPDVGERDPAIMEGVIAVVRAYAEFDPNTKGIKFYGLEDLKDSRRKFALRNNFLRIITDLVKKLPFEIDEERKDSLDQMIDILQGMVDEGGIEKAISKIKFLVDTIVDGHESENPSYIQPYEELMTEIQNYRKVLSSGKTRRDRAYMLMIKRRDRNAEINFDGQYYTYKLSPELIATKQKNAAYEG